MVFIFSGVYKKRVYMILMRNCLRLYYIGFYIHFLFLKMENETKMYWEMAKKFHEINMKTGHTLDNNPVINNSPINKKEQKQKHIEKQKVIAAEQEQKAIAEQEQKAIAEQEQKAIAEQKVFANNFYKNFLNSINEKKKEVNITNILNEYLNEYEKNGLAYLDYVINDHYELLNKITIEQESSIKEYINDDKSVSILNTILILLDLKLERTNERIKNIEILDKLKETYVTNNKQNDSLKRIIKKIIENNSFDEEEAKNIIYLTVNLDMSINNKKENWNEIFENLQKKFDEQNNSLGGKKTKNQKPKTKNQKPKTKNQKPKTKNQKPKTKNKKQKKEDQKNNQLIFMFCQK
jgi:hypothetical protein